MIRGDRGFKRCKHVNLARAADLENRAAAISDIQVFVLIECQTGRNTHAFYEHRSVSVRSHLVYDAVVTARYIERAFIVQSEAGGVHDVGDKGPRRIVQINLVNRYRGLLAARSTERGVYVPKAVHCGVRNRIQVVGDLDADIAVEGSAGLIARLDNQLAGRGAFGYTHHHVRVGADHYGRRDIADRHTGTQRSRQTFPTNLKFSAGDGSRRSDGFNLRSPVGVFPYSHINRDANALL